MNTKISNLPKIRRYYFICKNKPEESFSKDIPRDFMNKNIGWLCESMKEQYEMKQDKYLVDGSIESIFDNLGFVDMYQSLQDLYLTRIFYFSVYLASEGITVRYCTFLNNKNTEDIVKLPSGISSTVLLLKQAIAQQLQAELDRVILRYQGVQLLDEQMTLDQVGIKGGKDSKRYIRVVLLKSVFLLGIEGNREKIMLDPYQNLQMQISKLINKPEKEFVVKNDEGKIVDHIDKIKQNETIKVRDCLSGDITINIQLKSEEDFEDEEEMEESLKLKVLKSDSVEFIIGLFRHFHEIPYIIALADINMKPIKQTTKISELLDQEIFIEKEQSLKLFGICKYTGEVTIISKQSDNIVLSLNFKERVVDLKRILENKIGIDQLDQLLYYKGSVLQDSKQLSDYSICNGSKISVEENIFKESRVLSNKQSFVYQNASQAASTSRSIDLLYKLNNFPDRQTDNDAEIFGQGLNILSCCTSNFCKQSYSDQEMICLKGLGAHLVSVLDNSVLENFNCKRCLSPALFKGFVMKDCSVIFIEQTNEGIKQNFTWNSFGVLNIVPFKECSSKWRSIYFSVTEQLKSHKNSEMTNCLICRQDFMNDGQQTHKECLDKFPFDFHSVFELAE